MLDAVKRARQAGRDLPTVAWLNSTIVETSLPALGIAFMTSAAAEAADRPLVNPAAFGLICRLVPYAITFLIGGVVAGETRKHVNAALREAEVQRAAERDHLDYLWSRRRVLGRHNTARRCHSRHS